MTMAQNQVIRAATLPASSRLALAISAFEKDLSTEQKLSVHQNKTNAPDIDDVYRITSTIDKSGGRCYGPRLTTFLQSLQQFASIGDVLVGGSQNLIACGVWSVVRFSLLAIAKYASYVEKLSELFMSLGRMTPQFQELAALYVHSKRLQDSVFEYYIVVVKVCHEILRLSKKSALGALLTNFGHMLESYTSDLKGKAESIKLEMHLEATKEARREAHRNVISQALILRSVKAQKIARQQTSRRNILDACSMHDYQTTWKQTRKMGNTSLFKQAEGYLEWVQRSNSCTLVYSGKLGYGKSVLLANIVDDLYLQRKENIVYFFCRHDIRDSLWSRTIIGSLARQLLQRHPNLDFLSDITTADLESRFFGMDELENLIQHSVSKPIYFVLDGLDECTDEERLATMKCIERLRESTQILLCTATRFVVEESRDADDQSQQNVLRATIPPTNPDVETYVDLEIDSRFASGRLRLSNDALIPEIKRRLVEESQGMFLWIYLLIQSLSLMESDHDIKAALLDLPQGLSETYSRLLRQHGSTRYQRDVLELILAALRPLTTEELREALSVEPGNTEYDPERLIKSITHVLQTCGGLVMTDEEEETVRLVHSSTRQFLTTEFKEAIQPTIANQKLLKILLTYLNYSLLETQVSRNVNLNIPTASIPAAIIIDRIPIARKIVKPSRNRKLDETFGNMAMPGSGIPNEFQDYAQSYWARHMVLFEMNSDHFHLLRSALSKKRIEIHDAGDDGLTPLQLGAQKGWLALVELLLAFFPRPQDKEKAAILGALGQNAEIVRLLLEQMNQGSQLDSLLFDALAAGAGLLITALCKTDRISKNPKNKNGESPAMFAIKRNKPQMIEVLGAESLIPGNQCSDLVKTAVQLRFKDVLQELSKVRAVQKTYASETVAANLWSWIFSVNYVSGAMINVLLDNKILTNRDKCKKPKDIGTRTPLMVAAEHGRGDLVDLLLARDDVKVNAVIAQGERFIGGKIVPGPDRTALDLASSETVRYLLRQAGGLKARHLYD